MEKIGSGMLGVAKEERDTGRYGTVILSEKPDSAEHCDLSVPRPGKRGFRGRLVIVEAGSPQLYYHVGTGILFFANGAVGVKPDELNPEWPWLNRELLDELWGKNVTIYFEYTP